MCCECFFIVKVRFLKVSDERGEGREVHSNATYGRKDGGVFAGGEGPIGKDGGRVCPGAGEIESGAVVAMSARTPERERCGLQKR